MRAIGREEGRRLFGAYPARYDRGRPGHPERVYRVLVETFGLGPGTRVLEVGPGTGQATRRLLELGATVVAVEPDPSLSAYLMSRPQGSLAVRNETLEGAALADQAFDLAVAASCFHWIDEDVGLAKLGSALRPGGAVALWWTLFGADDAPDEFQHALRPVLDATGLQLESSPSAGRAGRPRFALDVVTRHAALARAGFTRLEHELIPWAHTWDTAGIRALYGSFSPILRLDGRTRATVLDAVAEVAERQFGGRVERPLRTSLYTARRPLTHGSTVAG